MTVSTTTTDIRRAVRSVDKELRQELSENRRKARSAERRFASAEKRLAAYRSKHRKHTADTRKREAKLTAQVKSAQTEAAALAKQASELRQERQRLLQRESSLVDQVRRLTDDHHASTDLFEHAQRELERRGHHIRRAALDMDQLRRDCDARIARMQKDIETRDRALATAAARTDKLSDTVSALRKRALTAERRLRAALASRNKAVSKADDLRATQKRIRAQLAARELDLKQARQDIVRLRRSLAAPSSDTVAASRPEALKPTAAPAETIRWKVRSPDGDVYGPASAAELLLWAADCRIGPDHAISRDGKNWQPAHELPELEMEWTVRLPGGEVYGPVHRDAFPDLVRHGIIPATAMATHVPTQRKARVSALLTSSAADTASPRSGTPTP